MDRRKQFTSIRRRKITIPAGAAHAAPAIFVPPPPCHPEGRSARGNPFSRPPRLRGGWPEGPGGENQHSTELPQLRSAQQPPLKSGGQGCGANRWIVPGDCHGASRLAMTGKIVWPHKDGETGRIYKNLWCFSAENHCVFPHLGV